MKSFTVFTFGTLLFSSVLGQSFNTDIGNKEGSHSTVNNNNAAPGVVPTASGGPVSTPTGLGGMPNVPNVANILSKSQALLSKMGLNSNNAASTASGGPVSTQTPATSGSGTGSSATSGPSFNADIGNKGGSHEAQNNNNAGAVSPVAPDAAVSPSSSSGSGSVPPISSGSTGSGSVPPVSSVPSGSGGASTFNSDIGNTDGTHQTTNNNNAGSGPASAPIPSQDSVTPVSAAPATGGATFNTDIGNEGGSHNTENNNNH